MQQCTHQIVEIAATCGTISNSMIVDGTSLLVGSKENGRAILRRFDIQATGAPTLAATRDLGDLMGGELTGIALNGGNLVAVGSSSNAALSGATVSRAASGGQDAFAISLSKDLIASSSDRIAFLGGAGQDRATAMTVSDGKLWLTGTSTGAIDSAALMGTKDGFVSRFDISTGTQEWTRRFTAKEKSSVPSSIAVASGGASVLDRLGLPSGQIAYSDSTLLTSATSVRAGGPVQNPDPRGWSNHDHHHLADRHDEDLTGQVVFKIWQSGQGHSGQRFGR